MAVRSCGFAVGNLRARENTLLKQSDLIRFASAKDVTELSAMLRDKGIGDQTSNASVPEMLRYENEKLFEYLMDIAPDVSLFEPFLYENDFHNMKAVLKAIIKNTGYEKMILSPSLIPPELFEKAFSEKRFDILPDYVKTTAEQAYSVITQSGDPQLCDGIIDAGCMAAQTERAKTADNRIISEIIAVSVFYKNIKTALRAARARKSADFLDKTVTETAYLKKERIVKAALQGEDDVLELLSTVTKAGGAAASEYYRRSPSEFEKYVDDRITAAAKNCKTITLGAEPLIGYMLAKKSEIKDIRIIYSGIKTGADSEITTERLRELYG